MKSKSFWPAAALCAALAVNAAEPSAQKPEPAKAQSPTQAQTSPKAKAGPTTSKPASAAAGGAASTLPSKYCCDSPSGKACHVFGAASCSNCDTFCNGQIVIR